MIDAGVQGRLSNVLLRALPQASFARLASHLAPIALPHRFKLTEAGKDCPWVYFLESGVASVVGRVGNEWQEIGLFGQEGVGSLSVVLGNNRPIYLMFMQVPGLAYRLPASVIQTAFVTDADVREVILRYLQAFVIQVSQTSIANCQYNTVQRLARWFLMIHDRVEGDSILLTHELIATMLGVGRTGVTLALHALEKAGLISTARKRITILDRAGLEAMTATVYGVAEAEYQKLLGPIDLPHSSASAA